jgi:hypothetical protein
MHYSLFHSIQQSGRSIASQGLASLSEVIDRSRERVQWLSASATTMITELYSKRTREYADTRELIQSMVAGHISRFNSLTGDVRKVIGDLHDSLQLNFRRLTSPTIITDLSDRLHTLTAPLQIKTGPLVRYSLLTVKDIQVKRPDLSTEALRRVLV